MRVLTILEGLNMGGIEKTFLEGIENFKELGIEPVLLTNSKDGVLEPSFREKEVKILYGPEKNNPILKAFILYRILLKEDIDVVHSRNGFTSGFYAIICWIMKTPIIISIHSSESNFRTHWENSSILTFLRDGYLAVHRLLSNRFATFILGHSKNNLSHLKHYVSKQPSKYRVVYNGINLKRFPKKINPFTVQSEVRLVHIGSFRIQKNHDTLLEIVLELIKKKYNVHLTMCGDGNRRKEIQDLAENLGLKNRVTFLGVVENPVEVLKESHILIFPSLVEGFGNVLVEAQSAGVAVCASDIAPHFEAVSPNYHKYFFPPKSAVKGAEKVEQIIKDIQDPAFLEQRVIAKKFSDTFSIENMVGNLFKIYKEAKCSKRTED